MAKEIVVTSSSHLPRFCAGVSFKGAMAFTANRFTEAQLRELLSDRLLTVVVGQVLTLADVDFFVEENGLLPAVLAHAASQDRFAGSDITGRGSQVLTGQGALHQTGVGRFEGVAVFDAAAGAGALMPAAAATTMAPRHAGLGPVSGTAETVLEPGTAGLEPAAGARLPGTYEADGARVAGAAVIEGDQLPATLGSAETAAATGAADTALIHASDSVEIGAGSPAAAAAGHPAAVHARTHAGRGKVAK